MIRRAFTTFLFVLLGFASLPVLDATYAWTCNQFPGFCRAYTGPCPGIDTCSRGFWESMAIIAIYLGPAVVFGATGFVLSQRSRGPLFWLATGLGFVCAHSMLMIFVIRETAN